MYWLLLGAPSVAPRRFSQLGFCVSGHGASLASYSTVGGCHALYSHVILASTKKCIRGLISPKSFLRRRNLDFWLSPRDIESTAIKIAVKIERGTSEF